jgi:hypothetical protein
MTSPISAPASPAAPADNTAPEGVVPKRTNNVVAIPSSRHPKLVREVFATSRLLEFCSLKELVNQTGHGAWDWPLVVLKELVDNAIDACEEAGVSPYVAVAVADGKIVVTDNGPGIEHAEGSSDVKIGTWITVP